MLVRWNKTHNLTAITDPNEMLSRHIYDSLSIQPFITADRIADVGSGGGLPAIPLAITNPERDFTLIEPSGKKVGFLRQVAIELQLKNIEVMQSRVQDYHPQTLFKQIMCRAFASMSDFVAQSDHLLANDGEWLAMKGQSPTAELAALAEKFEYTVNTLKVPELEADRHLITIKKRLND